jgi:hypothetical protein
VPGAEPGIAKESREPAGRGQRDQEVASSSGCSNGEWKVKAQKQQEAEANCRPPAREGAREPHRGEEGQSDPPGEGDGLQAGLSPPHLYILSTCPHSKLFGVMKTFSNWIVVMVTHLNKFTRNCHSCNPSYFGRQRSGGSRFRSQLGQIVCDPILKRNTKQRTKGLAEWLKM